MLPDFSKLEQQYGLPAGLLNAVAIAESSGDPKAVSKKGAQGLFQFMPATAKEYGIDPFDSDQAAMGAAMKFRDLHKRYKADLPMMLAAYNYGDGNLARSGFDNLPEETSNYIAKVQGLMGGGEKQYADSGQIMNDASVDGGMSLEQQQAIAIAEAEAALGEDIPAEEPVVEKVQQPGFTADGDPLDTSIGRTILDQSLQGLPLVGTFTDEVTSALGGLGAGAYLGYRNNMPEWLGGFAPGQEIDFDLGELMGQAEKLGNERVNAQLEENPGTSILSQLGSGLFTGGALLKGAGATPTLFKGSKDVADLSSKIYNWTGRGNAITRAGKIAATGIPSSFLYGMGDDTGEGRLDNAMDASLWGALPAALPIVGAAGRKGAQLAKGAGKTAVAAKNIVLPPDPEKFATSKILQRLADDNMTLEGLEARLARMPQGSAIIDAGRGNIERLAEASANLPGKGANDAVKFVSRRVSNEPKAVKSAVSDYVASGDFHGTMEKIIKDAEEKVKPLYQQVYKANPSVQSKEIDRILQTPAGKTALKNAAELMLNDRKLLGFTDPELLEQAKLAGQHIEGGIASGLKMQTMDYVKRALDDMWNSAPYGSNERRILNGLRKDMVNALDEADASGLYKEARKIWAGSMSGQEAMETGKDILKMDTHELKKYFNGLGESEKELFKLGAAQSLRETVSSTPDRLNMARKIFGREEYRDNLRAILGHKDFNKLRASLMRQEKQHLLNNRLLGNSRTALRTAEQQDLNLLDPEAAVNLATGNIPGFLMRGLKENFNNLATGLNRNTAGNVTSMLLETDPAKQKQIIQQLRAAQNKKSPLQSLVKSTKKVPVP